MNASVAIQVLPKADSDEELIRIVDEVIDYIKSTGLNYYVGPCETSIEGDYDELMEIGLNVPKATELARALFRRGVLPDTAVYTHEQLLSAILRAGGEEAC